MEVDVCVLLEPAVAFLMGVEIVEDDVQLPIREDGDDVVHEAEEFDTTPPFGVRGHNLAGGHLKRGKQGRSAVPLVIVALTAQGASIRQLQVTLRPFQCLDRRLLIDTENDRLGRRVDIEADHIGSLRGKRGIVALAPRFARGQIDLVLAQETPNILNINVFQRLREQRARPPGIAVWGGLSTSARMRLLVA